MARGGVKGPDDGGELLFEVVLLAGEGVVVHADGDASRALPMTFSGGVGIMRGQGSIAH